MPEGDTIHYAANRIRPVLAGHVPDELRTPHPRFGRARWPERLAGRAVESVDAHGKHLFLRFEGGLTIHSHLRMTGSWRVLAGGQRWPRSPRAAWLVIGRGDREVVQFDGPVLELITEGRTRFDQRLAQLGPDVLAPELDAERFLRRLRDDDPTRPIGDALLDQRTIAASATCGRSKAASRPASIRGARSGPCRTPRRSPSCRPAGRACSSPRGTATRAGSSASTAAPDCRAPAAAPRR